MKIYSAFYSYLVYEPVGQVEESHHSTPVDAVSKNAPGHGHEDVLNTITLNLVDQSDRKKWTGVLICTMLKLIIPIAIITVTL